MNATVNSQNLHYKLCSASLAQSLHMPEERNTRVMRWDSSIFNCRSEERVRKTDEWKIVGI